MSQIATSKGRALWPKAPGFCFSISAGSASPPYLFASCAIFVVSGLPVAGPPVSGSLPPDLRQGLLRISHFDSIRRIFGLPTLAARPPLLPCGTSSGASLLQNEPGRHGGRPSRGENNLFLRFSGGSGAVPTVLAGVLQEARAYIFSCLAEKRLSILCFRS